jgi:hypothetical protein
LAFAAFAIVFMQSNLAEGIGAAFRTADVLVTVVLGAAGWAFARYLESVTTRFDESMKRFDATDERLDQIAATLEDVRRLLRAPPGGAPGR